jgi:signal transduction histidine kinase
MMGLRSSQEPSSREHLTEISSMLSQSLDEVREIAYDLRPYHLDRIGLTRTIEFIIEKVRGSTGMRCVSDLENIDHLLPPDGETSVYRVVQEALNNIVKHSGATEFSCTIRNEASRFTIELRDNGHGFDADRGPRFSPGTGGMGLSGMTERVRLLHGTIVVTSAPGEGTTLTATIPVRKNA